MDERLKGTSSKIDVDTDYLSALGIGLQAVLHRARIKQYAGFPNAKRLPIRLHYVKAARAQKVEVTGSIRIMIARYSTEGATEVGLCREGEVSEDYRQRVHFDLRLYPAVHNRNGIDKTRGYGNETNSIDPTADRDVQSCVQPVRLPKIGEKSMATQYVSVTTVPATLANDAPKSIVTRILTFASSLDRVGMGLLRFGLVIVLLWIGGLKFAAYEADSIVPLIANSPLISFVYHHPAPEYKHYLNKEGELKPANRMWHQSNGTYPVSYGLGVIIVSLGILIALYPVRPELSAIGSFLLILMAFTTLSFLITTPEAWVPALGDSNHGFPYLSGVGRLIIKDSIMLGAAFLTMTDAARESLRRRSRRG